MLRLNKSLKHLSLSWLLVKHNHKVCNLFILLRSNRIGSAQSLLRPDETPYPVPPPTASSFSWLCFFSSTPTTTSSSSTPTIDLDACLDTYLDAIAVNDPPSLNSRLLAAGLLVDWLPSDGVVTLAAIMRMSSLTSGNDASERPDRVVGAQLQSLNVRSNYLGVWAAAALSRVIAQPTATLASLNVSRNSLGEKGAQVGDADLMSERLMNVVSFFFVSVTGAFVAWQRLTHRAGCQSKLLWRRGRCGAGYCFAA